MTKNSAGEILINSIDRDGSKKGYDIKLLNNVQKRSKILVITCGGVGNWQLLDIAAQTGHKDVNVLRKHYAKMQGEHLAKKLNETGDNN